VTFDDNALEQRLLGALNAAAAAVEPSGDLWSRVLHSIDEDRRHRRRVISVMVASLAIMCLAAVAVLVSLEEHPTLSALGHRVGWWQLELVESVVLVTLIACMAPAIRRFGRGYADDLFPQGDTTGDRLIALLDVAYLLVFTGYLFVSAEFTKPHAYVVWDFGEQLAGSVARIAGLLLLMGVLHAATFMALPLLALVANTTRTGRRLPGWVAWLVAIPFLIVFFKIVLVLVAGLATTLD
jgi:hypothetical protein